MAQSAAILHKLARNAKMLGLTVNSESQTAVVIENGSNDITISYANATFDPAVVGGVDSTVSPYLGIGVGNPGQVVITCADTTQTAVWAQVLAMCASLANDITLAGGLSARLRGHSDLLGLGE